MTAPLSPVELSILREDDGDMCLELYLDKTNQISISVNRDGGINWAGMLDGTGDHSYEPPTRFGRMLFELINKGAAYE